MQIQLKQAEIVEALKQYVSSQGISLSDKKVEISFTAGRKQSGISADIEITDAEIPGFTDSEDDAQADPEAPKPALAAVVSITKATAEEDAPAVEEPPASDDLPTKTTSLFS